MCDNCNKLLNYKVVNLKVQLSRDCQAVIVSVDPVNWLTCFDVILEHKGIGNTKLYPRVPMEILLE